MKSKSAKSIAILGISSSLLLVATLLPAASAIELSLTSSVELEVQKSALVIEPGTAEFLFAEDDLTATASGAIFSTQLALVSAVSRQVELARTPLGAKKVAKSILFDEYGFEEKEYKCLNQLWTQESNWNYKSRNKVSGAHGIPQALPALALADKVLGKAEKLGLIDASDVPAIPMDDEAALGKLLLAIVSSARASGLEPERALREATREFQVEIRSFELDTDNDAGVIGSYGE